MSRPRLRRPHVRRPHPRRHVLAVALAGATVVPAVDATAAPASAYPATLDDAAVARAVAGATTFIADNADSIEAGISAPCPLVSTGELGWSMGEQGLAPSFDGWSVQLFMYESVGGGAPAIACGVDVGARVAAGGRGAAHGIRLEAVVVPAGAALADLLGVVERGAVIDSGGAEVGGQFGGACYPGRVAMCVLMWYRSGFAVTTVLTGPPASVDADRAIALMTAVIPTIVGHLGDHAPPPTTTPTTVATPALDIRAARATLAEFLVAHPVGAGPEVPGALVCPAITAGALGDAISDAALPPDVEPFHVSVRSSAVAPGLISVACGGNVIDALVQASSVIVPGYTPSLTVYDITAMATIDHVLAERPGMTLIESGLVVIGGDVYGSDCAVASGSGTFCVRVWHREGLVVMIELAGNTRPDLDAAATQVITTLVPSVVGNLADATIWSPSPA